MRYHLLVSLVVLIMLSACSDKNQDEVIENIDSNDTPKLVSNAKLHAYWTVQNDKFTFKSSSEASPKESGEVEIGFIIDANGQTSQFEVLRSSPDNLWDEHALKGAKQLNFKKAESNNFHGKIYTTWLFSFKAS